MLDSIDVLLTANPDLLLNEDKIVIKYEQIYNQNIISKYNINKIKDLKNKITEIC
jgi:hypothetical protein